MEAISYESMSLAGRLGLNKLIVLYDSNDTTLDGDLNTSFNENIELRAKSQNWNYILVRDGNDVDEINNAILSAKTESNKPTVIEIKTVIGFGCREKQDTSSVHGSPLGFELTNSLKTDIGWTLEPFSIPQVLFEIQYERKISCKETYNKWLTNVDILKKELPKLYEELESNQKQEIILNLKDFSENKMATRIASNQILNSIDFKDIDIIGGAADLSTSTKTNLDNSTMFTIDDRSGRNIMYGVREFAMASITNGINLSNSVRGYCSTYLAFSDYMKSAIRMAAQMKTPSLFIFTHDSLDVGEDEPTHQPVEQLSALRSIPDLKVYRPADYFETFVSYKQILADFTSPSALVLSRQDLPILNQYKDIIINKGHKGGYTINEQSDYSLTLVASGSEVALALNTQIALNKLGVNSRVISVNSLEVLKEQDSSYIKTLSNDENTFIVEKASVSNYIDIFPNAKYFSVENYGGSGNPKDINELRNFTTEHLVEFVNKSI